MKLIDNFPFGIIFPAILVCMVLFGYWIAAHFYMRRNKNWTGSGVENAVIGLYALILSFTLLLSGNMQKDRNTMVHRASDAAGTISRASFFLSSDLQPVVKNHLLDYLNLQINFYENRVAHLDEMLKKTDQLNQQLWGKLKQMEADSAAEKEEIKLLLPLYDQLNSSFYRLVYSYDERIPTSVMLLLIVGSWLIAILIGFMNGLKQHRHYLVPIIYFVLVSLTIEGIRDLDNPYSGFVRPEYRNITEIRNYLLKN